jgi:hypothetical protein
MEMRDKQGVKFYKTPDPILKAQLASWDKIIAAKKAAENPLFKKVLESQRASQARRCMAERHHWSTSAWPTTTSSRRRAEARKAVIGTGMASGRRFLFLAGTCFAASGTRDAKGLLLRHRPLQYAGRTRSSPGLSCC